MNILVTGGIGFIGSHLTELLLAEGFQVCVIDQDNTDSVMNQFKRSANFNFVHGKVEDEAVMEKWVGWADVVFHLAASLSVKRCVEEPDFIINGNLIPAQVVLNKALKFKKKVVFASTSEVYGKSEAIPYQEDGDRLLGATCTHRWCYATVKALEEHMFLAAAKKGLPVTILRYFNAYGPRAKSGLYGGVIPIFITAALRNSPLYVHGDGLQSRCFTYVKDTVAATRFAVNHTCNGEVINVGSANEMSILQLAKVIIDLTNSKSEIQFTPYKEVYESGFEDMKKRIPCTKKMEQLLHYHAQTPLKEGLTETIDYYRLLLGS
ncbi:NAD-dependent epimerase/dehydratase family protein [Shouchella sp. JSM 1781072]|uniref:NAD-dependent epimerase/dehydratase family protein n=1 Tax=Bacillaceae TaxID=186817 RepID=UPI0020D1629E|nr:NAD-dependent epimerase/dehydratase family protein [Alkalihalobacillus sp. LMS6]UTR04990.1 GDP-mannose 4,6-dehydratase [Alkalihalobacillus sp. LMS6]